MILTQLAVGDRLEQQIAGRLADCECLPAQIHSALQVVPEGEKGVQGILRSGGVAISRQLTAFGRMEAES
jgi:hypothetical protein